MNIIYMPRGVKRVVELLRPNVCSMLGKRCKRWPSLKITSGHHLPPGQAFLCPPLIGRQFSLHNPVPGHCNRLPSGTSHCKSGNITRACVWRSVRLIEARLVKFEPYFNIGVNLPQLKLFISTTAVIFKSVNR